MHAFLVHVVQSWPALNAKSTTKVAVDRNFVFTRHKIFYIFLFIKAEKSTNSFPKSYFTWQRIGDWNSMC